MGPSSSLLLEDDGEMPPEVSITAGELSSVREFVDSRAFRELIFQNRRQCPTSFDTETTIEFTTDRWSASDSSAGGCILRVFADGGSHPYADLYHHLWDLRLRYFGPPPPPEMLATCLTNRGDETLRELKTQKDCAATGGTWDTHTKCIDGKPLPK